LYGEIYYERLRKTRDEADKVALENQITRAEYLPKAELQRVMGQLVAYWIQVIEDSPLCQKEKNEIRNSMSSVEPWRVGHLWSLAAE
jgi:hypothetical protein